MATLFPRSGDRVLDINGDPVSGAKVKFFEAGTSTPLAVYSDNALSSSLGATATCDANGQIPTIFLDRDQYKFEITDASDVTIFGPLDNFDASDGLATIFVGSAGGTADVITFTVTGITALETNRKYRGLIASDNTTTTPTVNINGYGAKTVVRQGGAALAIGDLQGGYVHEFVYLLGTDQFQLVGADGVDGSNGSNAYRNRLINGNMDLWDSTTVSGPATGDELAKQWNIIFDGSGATRTISRQILDVDITDADEAIHYLRFDQSVAGTGGSVNDIYQRILHDEEPKDDGVRALQNRTATVSFYAKAAAARDVTPEIIQNFGTGGSPSTAVTTTGTAISLTTSWTRHTQNIVVPSISGKTVGSNDDDYLEVRLKMPVDDTFTIDVTGIQIEEGSTATVFEKRAQNVEDLLANGTGGGQKGRVEKTDTFSMTGTTFTDITDMSITFTAVAGQKYRISAHLNYGNSGTGFGLFVVLRDSTEIGIGDAASNRERCTAATAPNSTTIVNLGFDVEDTPGAGSVTYKLQMKTSSGTAYINRTGSDSDTTSFPRTMSSFEVVEI